MTNTFNILYNVIVIDINKNCNVFPLVVEFKNHDINFAKESNDISNAIIKAIENRNNLDLNNIKDIIAKSVDDIIKSCNTVIKWYPYYWGTNKYHLNIANLSHGGRISVDVMTNVIIYYEGEINNGV